MLILVGSAFPLMRSSRVLVPHPRLASPSSRVLGVNNFYRSSPCFAARLVLSYVAFDTAVLRGLQPHTWASLPDALLSKTAADNFTAEFTQRSAGRGCRTLGAGLDGGPARAAGRAGAAEQAGNEQRRRCSSACY